MLANRLLDWALFEPDDAVQTQLKRAVGVAARRKLGDKTVALPVFFDPSRSMSEYCFVIWMQQQCSRDVFARDTSQVKT